VIHVKLRHLAPLNLQATAPKEAEEEPEESGGGPPLPAGHDYR
jgi:hypothetical protein